MPTRNVVVKNVSVRTRSACFAIGSEVDGGVHNVTVNSLNCRHSADGVRFKCPRNELVASNLTFTGLHLDTIGSHFPNQSGWPGSGISCGGASSVAYADVTGQRLLTPGYFSQCDGLQLTNIAIESEISWFCGTRDLPGKTNVSITGTAHNVSPPACTALHEIEE